MGCFLRAGLPAAGLLAVVLMLAGHAGMAWAQGKVAAEQGASWNAHCVPTCEMPDVCAAVAAAMGSGASVASRRVGCETMVPSAPAVVARGALPQAAVDIIGARETAPNMDPQAAVDIIGARETAPNMAPQAAVDIIRARETGPNMDPRAAVDIIGVRETGPNMDPRAAVDGGEADSVASALPPMLLTLQDDVTIIGLDGLHWLLAPLSWSGGEWLAAGGVLAATGGAMLIDEDVRDMARRNRSAGGDDLASLANEAGRLQWAQMLTGALYVPGLLLGVDELRVTGRMLAQSLMYSGAVTMALRIAFGRNRPWSGEPSDSYEGWQFGNDVQSLPSGHTTVAFAMASVLAPRIAHPAASVLLYLVAASTGVARVYEDHHWLSDVLLGAAIGQAAGMYVTNREERRTSGAGASASWMLVPSPRGVTFSYTF